MLTAAVTPTTQKKVRRMENGEWKTERNGHVDAGSDEHESRQGHAEQQFDLMVQAAAVVQDADDGQEGGAGQDGDDLGARGAVDEQQEGDHSRSVDGHPTQQGYRDQVDLARIGLV